MNKQWIQKLPKKFLKETGMVEWEDYFQVWLKRKLLPTKL